MSAGTSGSAGSAGAPTALATTRAELTQIVRPVRAAGRPVVLVPTMGALHAGHRALMAAAREAAGPAGAVVVSIFVNPLQFGPGEDFDRYPRTLDTDLQACREQGVDLVFAPSVGEVYPGGEPQVRVAAGPLGARLEGASRPGHFDGVLTVVLKLFHLVGPDRAVFGRKDRQQLALIEAMVRDLNLPIGILGVPIVREPDGLALSSRNRYLSPAQRQTALALSRALSAGQAAAAAGLPASEVRAAARAVLDDAGEADPPLTLDYLALAHPDGLDEFGPAQTGPAVLLVAAKVGSTRLIDNADLTVAGPPASAGGRR